ncbi:PAS domain S-box protein [Chlorobium limicola]|uniref:PAS domain S-box protein n=1 Tax=Chlorobium limicola TaxID=1092 RepID=UPI001F2A6E9C|nr:PAS domain S-box protein [Chlorobium limicola]
MQSENAELTTELRRLSMVVEATKAAYWDWDLQTGNVTVNGRWAAMIGYTLEELQPITIVTWEAFCHPDDLMEAEERLARHFEGDTDFYEIELRMRHKLGHWIWVLDRGKVFETDAAGKPLRMVGSHQDITARKLTEERLKQERNLFMGGPVSVFRRMNTSGLPVEYVSPNIETLFGYSSHELSSGAVSYSGMIHPDDLPGVLDELALCSADPQRSSFEQEYRIIRKDGKVIWVYDFTVITRDEKGCITHYEGYLLDNSSRKRSEESLAFNRKFEWIVSSLANQFINVPAGEIDSMINEALKIIGEFVQADRSYIFQYYDNQRLMDNTHEWCAGGIEPQIDILKQLSTDDFSWSTKKIAHNELLIVPRVSDLPDEAASERDILEQQDIQSLILIPLVSGTIPFGYIGFDAVREERQWPKEAASVLTLAGGIIANALQRKQVEQLIQSELDLTLKLSVSSSFEETLKSCLQAALDISGMDCGGIYLVNEADNSLSLAYSQGFSDAFVRETFCYMSDSSQCRLVANGSAIYSRFAEMNTNPCNSILNEGLKAVAVLPVISKSRVVASLNVASHSLDQVPEFARKALETVASHIGAAIAQATHDEKITTANRNFASLFDTIDDMLFIIADDGAILHTNAACTVLLGYSHDEFRRLHVLDVHPPERREEAGRTVQQMLSGQANVCHVPLLSKSGEQVPVETKITHGTWDGKPVLFGIIRDITERLKNQSALVESEQKFRELTEFLPLPLFETDLHGMVTYINLEVKAFFGLSDDDLRQGISAFSFCVLQELDRALANQKKILAPGYVPKGNEYTIIMKDGTRRPVLLYSSPIRQDGQVSGVRTTLVDLSELKRAEAVLRESDLEKRVSEEFKSIIDNIPGAVYRHSSDDTIKFLSHSDFLSAESLGSCFSGSLQQMLTFIHPDDMRLVVDTYEELRERKASKIIIYRILTAAHAVRWIEDRKTSAFSEEGVFSGIDGILFDITDRVLAQEENQQLESRLRNTQRLETIGTLAGGIAHDFNNILTPVLGYAEMGALSLSDQDPLKEYFTEITQAAERARNLVAQILSFSRADERTPSVVSVQAILNEALKLLRPSIPSTITIEQQIDNSCGNIFADPSQIHQVVVNLCTNAFQAMEESGGVLTIQLREIIPDAGMLKTQPGLSAERYIELGIADTGTGMDAATMERIFEPFFTTKSVNKGTGLGLSVVHGIITSNNGEIVVESFPGKGATFRIYLPVINERSEAPTGEDPLPKGNASILFVDDEQPTVQMMKMMMTKLGFRIRALNSPVQALELFRRNPEQFDLVITDLTMPEMTGVELARELHETSPQLPVILMTGYGKDIEYTIPLSRYGICKFLKKPVKFAQLASVINEVISHNNA